MPEVPDQLDFENLDSRVDAVEGAINEEQGQRQELEGRVEKLECALDEQREKNEALHIRIIQIENFLCHTHHEAMQVFRSTGSSGA